MHVSFNLLPSNSKIWVYQADRQLSNSEIKLIKKETELFLNNWTSHNNEIESSYEIRYNSFLIIGLNEDINSASGCSIDKSLNFIKSFQSSLGVNFLNRLNVACKLKNDIKIITLSMFESMIRDRKLLKDSIVFNNMINTKELYENNWETTVEKSWHKKFL